MISIAIDITVPIRTGSFQRPRDVEGNEKQKALFSVMEGRHNVYRETERSCRYRVVDDRRPRSLFYAIRIDWMIWNIAEPHTTKMNSASSHGPTGYFSSTFFDDLGTLPRSVIFLLAFSLAMRIRCLGAILAGLWLGCVVLYVRVVCGAFLHADVGRIVAY